MPLLMMYRLQFEHMMVPVRCFWYTWPYFRAFAILYFFWPYVNANDAKDRYLSLKYRKWFLPTWTGCPRANPSRFAELNKSMQSWLRLFYDLYRVASEAFPYAMTIFTCHCYFTFFRHMSMTMLLETNIFFSTIPYEKMWLWLSLFYDLFSDLKWQYIVSCISATVGMCSGWPRYCEKFWPLVSSFVVVFHPDVFHSAI